jgi:hypothetical protein
LDERLCGRLLAPGRAGCVPHHRRSGAHSALHRLVEQTEAFVTAAAEDRETGWDDQYMRMVLDFETGDERYRWLTQSLFVAEGRILGTGRVEYAVYRVT